MTISEPDRAQLRETAGRLRRAATSIDEIEAASPSRSEDPELLDVIADSLHVNGWLLEAVADRARIASLARSQPEAFAKALIALDADELVQLAELLRAEADSRGA